MLVPCINSSLKFVLVSGSKWPLRLLSFFSFCTFLRVFNLLQEFPKCAFISVCTLQISEKFCTFESVMRWQQDVLPQTVVGKASRPDCTCVSPKCLHSSFFFHRTMAASALFSYICAKNTILIDVVVCKAIPDFVHLCHQNVYTTLLLLSSNSNGNSLIL